jgi:hypothetical protein
MARAYPCTRFYPRFLFQRRLQGPPQKWGQKKDRLVAEVCLLALNLAARAYHLERGTWPANLEALRPKYVDAVPLDAFTSHAFRYRATATGFQIYSVGPDGKDNGGDPIDWQSEPPQGDIVAGTRP